MVVGRGPLERDYRPPPKAYLPRAAAAWRIFFLADFFGARIPSTTAQSFILPGCKPCCCRSSFLSGTSHRYVFRGHRIITDTGLILIFPGASGPCPSPTREPNVDAPRQRMAPKDSFPQGPSVVPEAGQPRRPPLGSARRIALGRNPGSPPARPRICAPSRRYQLGSALALASADDLYNFIFNIFFIPWPFGRPANRAVLIPKEAQRHPLNWLRFLTLLHPAIFSPRVERSHPVINRIRILAPKKTPHHFR